MTMWLPNLPEDRPKYLGLADAIEADLAAGAIAPGQRLPTHRDLAEALGVTVGTVTRGYAEAARRGVVRGEVGRGTVVCPPQEEGAPWWRSDPSSAGRIEMGLVTGLGGLDPELAPALRELASRPDIQDLLAYQPPRGMPRHREAGSLWCRRYGVEAGPERILVTSGGLHALMVLFSALFRQGDCILAAGVNYPGLLAIASLLGLRLAPVDCDEEGMLPEAVAEAAAREGARGLYFIPAMHNPTTACASPARLEALAQAARRRGLLVVEDAAYALTADAPCRTLTALAPERCFLVASVSKMVAGGLRTAFVASPPEQVERVALGISSTTWMAPPLCAEIASLWIHDGTADAVTRRKRAEAARRNELAAEILAGQRFRAQRQGYFLWLLLPEPWRGADFERAAAERGVTVIAGEAFAVGQTPAPAAVRVSLSAPRTREELAHGLGVLAELLRQAPRPGRAIV